MSDKNLWVVVPCMGRLAHLKLSLPELLKCPVRVVVVDYSCPDCCGDWVEQEYPDTKPGIFVFESGGQVCRVEGRKRFNKSRAHNAGARFAIDHNAEFLCFIDCDTIVKAPQFGQWCKHNAKVGRFSVFEPVITKKDLYGTLLVSTEDYLRAGKYDETYDDWGMEDMDMRLRLRLKCDIPYSLIPTTLAKPITHGDSLRTRFYAQKDKQVSASRNFAKLRKNVRAWTGTDLLGMPAGDLNPLLGYPRQR
jgi:hypothetical protein